MYNQPETLKNEKNCRINQTQGKTKSARINNMLKMQDMSDLLIQFSITLILNKKNITTANNVCDPIYQIIV